jgi:hypothetical protein
MRLAGGRPRKEVDDLRDLPSKTQLAILFWLHFCTRVPALNVFYGETSFTQAELGDSSRRWRGRPRKEVDDLRDLLARVRVHEPLRDNLVVLLESIARCHCLR